MYKEMKMTLVSNILRLDYPCCPGHTRNSVALRTLANVPSERYERRCKVCGQRWVIERTTIAERVASRTDRVEWYKAEEWESLKLREHAEAQA